MVLSLRSFARKRESGSSSWTPAFAGVSGMEYSRSYQARKSGGTMIHVVAIITAKPGQRAAVLEHFQANVPAVRAEAGCIEYGAAVDVENMGTAAYGPDAFVVIEKWESEDHLMAHAAAPHMKAYGAKTKDMLASRTIHVLKPV